MIMVVMIDHLHFMMNDSMGLPMVLVTRLGLFMTYTTPECGKWVQMVVTYRQSGECAVFMSGEKAPITHKGRNNDGKSSLTLGHVTEYKNHWRDCWIKGFRIYNRSLTDEEVDIISDKFNDNLSSIKNDDESSTSLPS